MLINHVSHHSRALFLTGTPVPLTVWKGLPYSRKCSGIFGKAVVSLKSVTITMTEDWRHGNLNIDRFKKRRRHPDSLEWKAWIETVKARSIF